MTLRLAALLIGAFVAGSCAFAEDRAGTAPGPGASAIDGFDFHDEQTEARYKRLIAEFRCPKCLNESLASSGAPIAADLRRTVRRLLEGGKSDAAVRIYLQERYGDFVLYDPPLRPATALLWIAPFLLAAVAVLALVRVAKPRSPAAPTASEHEQVRDLLGADSS